MKTGTAGECHRALGSGLDDYVNPTDLKRCTMTRYTAAKQGTLQRTRRRGGKYKVEWKKVTLKTIAGFGELAPFTNMNATQVHFQAPSGS